MLITGFGPFPGVPENPSARLVEAIRDGLVRLPPGVSVATAILPTAWDEVVAMAPELYARHRPDAALHFGLAETARGFRIEKLARNRTQDIADVHGRLPRSPCIRPNGSRVLRGRLKAETIVLTLRASGLPAEISCNAGGYLCNQLFYLSLAECAPPSRMRDAIFVHIPAVPAVLGMERLLTGAEAIVRACAAQIGTKARN